MIDGANFQKARPKKINNRFFHAHKIVHGAHFYVHENPS